jgi:hypothetical protein
MIGLRIGFPGVCWATLRFAQPCILFSVMVSSHHLRRRELEPTLKD